MSQGSKSPVYGASSDDPELQQASVRARATFKYLWRELTWEYRRIVPALDLAAIKSAFNDPGASDDQVEHMWLSEVEFDGERITASLLNSPNALTSVKQGDRITLDRTQLEDWMYVMSGRVYGGFTIQAMRAQMSASERRGHDRAWGLDFGEPSRIELAPNWQEGGKKTLLGRLFGGPPSPADPELEHPMSENMGPSLADAVAKDPAAFFELGPSGLNTLHSLALGGSAACVRVLLAAGADPHLKTKSGKTALELATLMGWPRVVALLQGAQPEGRGQATS